MCNLDEYKNFILSVVSEGTVSKIELSEDNDLSDWLAKPNKHNFQYCIIINLSNCSIILIHFLNTIHTVLSVFTVITYPLQVQFI